MTGIYSQYLYRKNHLISQKVRNMVWDPKDQIWDPDLAKIVQDLELTRKMI